MQYKSRVVEYLDVALRLANGKEAEFLKYLIKMAKDEAGRVEKAAA